MGRTTQPAVFQLKPDSYNTESLIGFLQGLKRTMRACPCLLIWDGLPAHKSRLMKEHLRRERRWLHVEPLPAYAPDLNPVETLWSNIKGRELATFVRPILAWRPRKPATRRWPKPFSHMQDLLCDRLSLYYASFSRF